MPPVFIAPSLPKQDLVPIGALAHPESHTKCNYADADGYSNSVCMIKAAKVGTNWAEPYLRGNRQNAVGTGFVVNFRGARVILTNDHVIRDATKLQAFFPSEGAKPFELSLIADSPENDLAMLVLSEEPAHLEALTLGDSDGFTDGSLVECVGYPGGQDGQKVAGGRFSGVQMMGATEYMQTDTALNHGNSGGPMVSISTGEVVGISDAIIEGMNNVGYAIPSALVKVFLSNVHYLQQKTKSVAVLVRKPYYGFDAKMVNAAMLGYIKSSNSNGVYLSKVIPGSVAASAGLKTGDQLVSVQGNKIDSYGQCRVAWSKTPVPFIRVMYRVPMGEPLSMDYVRDGEVHNGSTETNIPDPRVVAPIYTPFDAPEMAFFTGVLVQQLSLNHVQLYAKMNPELMPWATSADAQVERPALIVTKVLEGGPMEGKVAAGMLLESFNEKPVATIAELAEHCTAAPGQAFNKIGMQSGRAVFLSNKELIGEQNRITEEYGHYKVEIIKAKVCECKDCGSGQGHSDPSSNSTAPVGARARPEFGAGEGHSDPSSNSTAPIGARARPEFGAGEGHSNSNSTAPIGARARPDVTVDEQFGVVQALNTYAARLQSRREAPKRQGRRRRRVEQASAKPPRCGDTPICAAFDEVDIEELRRVLPHDTLIEMGIAI